MVIDGVCQIENDNQCLSNSSAVLTDLNVITGKMRRVVDWGKLRELLGEYVENGEPEWRVRGQV